MAQVSLCQIGSGRQLFGRVNDYKNRPHHHRLVLLGLPQPSAPLISLCNLFKALVFQLSLDCLCCAILSRSTTRYSTKRDMKKFKE